MELKILGDNPNYKSESVRLPQSINKIIKESLIIEAEDAKAAGRLGFMARTLIQATMPHSDPGEIYNWQRKNGNFSFFMQSGISEGENCPVYVGLPYGTIPRLLLTWISSEVIKKRERTLILGNTLSEFLSKLGLSNQGGARGDITRLKEQQMRLFSSTLSYIYKTDNSLQKEIFNVADTIKLFWEPKKPEEVKWHAEIKLSERFFEEILNNSVPIDIGAIKALKNSALALDIYCWLTYRMSYLNKAIVIPWEVLRLQFGSDYAETKQGRYKFKLKFTEQLKKVLIVYNQAKAEKTENGLLLKPSQTHIK